MAFLSENSKKNAMLKAIIFMIIGGISITIMQASVKFLSGSMHPFVITFFRAFLVPFIFLPALFLYGNKVFSTSSFKLQAIRGVIGGSGMLCVFTGLSMISLAEATTLLFTVPIFATLLSIVFLSERVGVRRWSAIIFGFLGILVVMRPEVSFGLGYALLLCAAVSWSISILIGKKLTEKDSIISITFWQAVGCVPITFFASLLVWEWPSFKQVLLLFAIAGLGTVGHALLYSSLKLGRISFILPLDYIRIIWSSVLGFMLFGYLPTLQLYAGSMMIIGAAAFISYREMKIAKPLSEESAILDK